MKWFDEFKTFIQRGNVIELAVAVIMGAAFNDIVKALVGEIFTPLLGMVTQGGEIFSGLDVTVWGDAKIRFGAFIRALINFVLIAFCVFWIVKAVNALHVHKILAGEPKPTELTTQEKLLTEIRDLLQGKPVPSLPPPEPPPTGLIVPDTMKK